MHGSRILGGAIQTLVLMSLGMGAAAACTTTFPDTSQWPDRLELYLEATESSAVLRQSIDGKGTDVPGIAAPGGIQGWGQAVLGPLPPEVTFTAESALTRAYYVNAAQMIVGKVFWKATTQHGAYFRITLYADDVLVGGVDCARGAAARTGFDAIIFAFRTEASYLPAGARMNLRIRELSGADGVVFGTSDAAQTQLVLSTYAEDPLSGLLLVENHQLQRFQNETGSDERGKDPASPTALFFVAASLVAPPRRRRMALLVIAMVSFAGCSTPRRGHEVQLETLSPTPQGTAQINSTQNPHLIEKGQAVIRGSVRDDNGLPLSGANVFIEGTNRFTKTPASGAFLFANLSAGSYRLHAVRHDYVPFNQTLDVRVGDEVRIDIRLARAIDPLRRPHLHPNADIGAWTPLWEAGWTPTFGGAVGGTGPVFDAADRWLCRHGPQADCSAPVPGTVKAIPPGTSRIRVVLHWGPSSDRLELGLAVSPVSPYDPAKEWRFAPRPQGVAFNIPIMPQEADAAHQVVTDWSLRIWAPVSNVATPLVSPPLRHGTNVSLASSAQQGIVPFEPAHPDHWNGKYRLELFNATKLIQTCPLCDYPPKAGATDGRWAVDALGGRVPHNATEIRGELRWSRLGSPDASVWGLAFKAADSHVSDPTWRPATAERRDTGFLAFRIPLAGPEAANLADSPYQRKSGWQFAVDDGKPPEPLHAVVAGGIAAPVTPNPDPRLSWSLTVHVLRAEPVP